MGRVAFTALVGAAALAAAGCGATQTISQAVDPVAKAADVTARVPGYRMTGTIQTTASGLPVHMTMTGSFDRAAGTAELHLQAAVLGHTLRISERFIHLTLYMNLGGSTPVLNPAHGRRWIKLDMAKALSGLSLGSLPTTGSDPSQYLDYLRAESDRTRRVGPAAIRGVQSTHYHAVVDLRRYPNLLPASRRAAARKTMAALESAIGAHTMPMDVWIDHQARVRQLRMQIPQCVDGQRVHMEMTLDMYDYGPQPRATVPPASQTTDLTSRVRGEMSTLKNACTTSA